MSRFAKIAVAVVVVCGLVGFFGVRTMSETQGVSVGSPVDLSPAPSSAAEDPQTAKEVGGSVDETDDSRAGDDADRDDDSGSERASARGDDSDRRDDNGDDVRDDDAPGTDDRRDDDGNARDDRRDSDDRDDSTSDRQDDDADEQEDRENDRDRDDDREREDDD